MNIRAPSFGLTPIMEDLAEMRLESTGKKSKDDSDRKIDRVPLIGIEAHTGIDDPQITRR